MSKRSFLCVALAFPIMVIAQFFLKLRITPRVEVTGWQKPSGTPNVSQRYSVRLNTPSSNRHRLSQGRASSSSSSSNSPSPKPPQESLPLLPFMHIRKVKRGLINLQYCKISIDESRGAACIKCTLNWGFKCSRWEL